MDQEIQEQGVHRVEQLTSGFPSQTINVVFIEGYTVTSQSEIKMSLIHESRIRLECPDWETGSWIEVSMDQLGSEFTVEWVSSFSGSREALEYNMAKPEHEKLCRLLKAWIRIVER